MIRVVCTCGRAFKTEDRHAGKHTKCPECGAGLTIGPAPSASSSGGEVKEVPPWWYATDPKGHDPRASAPTRTGSDPGPDALNTMVLPPGYDSTSSPQAPRPSTRPVASAKAQSPPPRAPYEAQVQVPAQPSFPDKKTWTIAGGTIGLTVLALGAIFWLRAPNPGVEPATPPPRAAQLDKSDNLGQSKPSTPSGAGHASKAPDNPTDSKATGDAAPSTAPSAPTVEVAGAPNAPPAGLSRRLRMLVPAYIYPAGEGRKEWQRLFDAASKVDIVAIANPNSGPGDERNVDYAAIFTEASNQGITLVGYVSTDYGRRLQAEIKNDVDTWMRLYPQIRGFFFDQQPRDARDAARFADLRDYAKRKIRDPLVITNPGIPCDEAYLAQAVSNVTCVFVNFQGFEVFELPPTLKSYEPLRFAAMPYSIADVETMRTIVKDAIIKRIGYLYISDAKPPNQWGKLPIYWEAEVDAVSRVR